MPSVDRANLSAISFETPRSIFDYATPHTLLEVSDAAYFGDVAERMKVGDMIFATTSQVDPTPVFSVLVVYGADALAGTVSTFVLATGSPP